MARKIKRYKVGMDSETYKISMVSEPAIEVDYVALAKQDDVQIKLSSDERHICYGPALIPNVDIYRNNGEQEYYINFTEESIVKMSQEFMKNYRQHEVNLQHEEDVDEVFVSESWLVEDPYKDKANALGINVPKGTWMVAMRVNNLDTWERVKSGELKGFSVESAISLEEFSKSDNNMSIETNDMFWDKLINVLKETFSKKEEKVVEEPIDIEPTNIDLEAEPVQQTVTEPVTEPEPTVTPEPVQQTVTEPVKEPEPAPEPKNEPVVEEPKPEEPNPLEELVKNLTEEIKALKEANEGLQDKIKDLGKQPSAAPVNVNAKPSAGDTYAAWREQMRDMIG